MNGERHDADRNYYSESLAAVVRTTNLLLLS